MIMNLNRNLTILAQKLSLKPILYLQSFIVLPILILFLRVIYPFLKYHTFLIILDFPF